MPKLLIVSRCSHPRGGADQIIADLCRHLPKYGWDVSLGLTEGATFNRPDKYCQVHANLPVEIIDGTLGTRNSRLKELDRCIRRVQPDVILIMRVFDALQAVTQAASQPRLVVGVRAYESEYLSDVRRYRDAIDYCVTSGKLIEQACIEWAGMEASRVKSIAGGVQAPLKTTCLSDLGDRPIRLLYAGRLDDHQKRCGDFIPFIEQLSAHNIQFRFDFAGLGTLESTLKERLARFVANGSVRFHGWVDKETLYEQHYPHADIFVHFAAWEGVTIAPREAMAHGVIPVISRFDGLLSEGQFVHEKNALTFPVGDVPAALACIKRLIDSTDLREDLSLNAMRSQAGEYSFAGAIETWHHTLSHALELPPKHGKVVTSEELLPGRLTRLGIPLKIQSILRRLLNSPVRHQSPGSEWPTSSGMLSKVERKELEQFAAARNE